MDNEVDHKSIDKYVGSRVRMRRLLLKLTQENIGDAMGISFQQVQKYEKGASRVGASRLLQLAQVLQVPVAFFFEGRLTTVGETDSSPMPDYVVACLATREGLEMIAAFGRIRDVHLRRSIVDLVGRIAA